MNAILLLAALVLGAILGAVIGFLYARTRLAGASSDLAARTKVAEEQARAARHHAQLIDEAAQERAALIDGYLAERFQALSSQALDASQQRLLEVSEIQMRAANLSAAGELDSRRNAVEQMVEPLKQTLARVETQLREAEAARQSSQAALTEQVKSAKEASEQLRAQTQSLVTALRRPEARGRWGEMQLRRVVELAGMSARCDFDEQVSVADPGSREGADAAGASLRPDMVIRLAGGKNIVVDSKVSLAAYLEAAEAGDDAVRDARMAAHARHLKDHVDRLAAKAYWTALSPSPEFVVLFIPGEAFLAPALEREPGLLEYSMSRRVHIATPTTLVTMLRTAQYAWQQDALSENARAVFDLGRELYDRLSHLGRNVDALGRSLATAVTSYNRAVGSLESRVLVSARKLNTLGVTDAVLDSPQPVEESVRMLSAPDLVTMAKPELVAPDLAAGRP
jgi:DNA recombination protein RmuC